MASDFSKDGRYFAHLIKGNKLTIWETSTNKDIQKFTTASPCTCLQFVQDHGKGKNSVKKKRRQSLEASSVYLALGTTTGDLIVYSVSKANLDFIIKNETKQSVDCLSWSSGSLLYSGVHQNIVTFNLDKQIVVSKWKSGKGKLTSILSIPESSHLLTASRKIKLWDTSENQLLKIFTTSNHEVTLLRYISPTQENPAAYFVGSIKDNRSLSVWNLNHSTKEKNAMAQLILEDLPSGVSVCVQDGITNLVAVTRSGIVQIFRHTFNGNIRKSSLKPDVTIHIASKTEQNVSVARIPISSAVVTAKTDLSLHLCYGNKTFERVGLNDLSAEKVQCWIREDLRSNKKQPAVIQNGDSTMESRLKNLSPNHNPEVKELNVDEFSNILVKELQKGNKEVLTSLMCQTVNEDIIKNTLKKFPADKHDLFLRQIVVMSKDRLSIVAKGSTWLKQYIKIYGEVLISNEKLMKSLNSISDNMEERLLNNTSLFRLSGKLDFLVSQISKNQEENTEDDDKFLLINDAQSKLLYDGDSDLDIDDLEGSGEEMEWMEEEEEESNEEEEQEVSSDSSDMDTESDEAEEDHKRKSNRNT